MTFSEYNDESERLAGAISDAIESMMAAGGFETIIIIARTIREPVHEADQPKPATTEIRQTFAINTGNVPRIKAMLKEMNDVMAKVSD